MGQPCHWMIVPEPAHDARALTTQLGLQEAGYQLRNQASSGKQHSCLTLSPASGSHQTQTLISTLDTMHCQQLSQRGFQSRYAGTSSNGHVRPVPAPAVPALRRLRLSVNAALPPNYGQVTDVMKHPDHSLCDNQGSITCCYCMRRPRSMLLLRTRHRHRPARLITT
jgi:hypothetical protein